MVTVRRVHQVGQSEYKTHYSDGSVKTEYKHYAVGSIGSHKVPKHKQVITRTRWVDVDTVGDDDDVEVIGVGYYDNGEENGFVLIKYLVNGYGASL